MSQQIVESDVLAARFDIETLPLRFADSIEDLSAVSLRKLARAGGVAAELVRKLVRTRPDIVYFTLSPAGGAFYRDLVYVAILKRFGVKRVFHLHGKGIAAHLRSESGRALCKWAFGGAHVIHLSPQLAFDTDGAVDPDRVLFVPNGVADRGPPPATRPQRRARILFLSHMVETKGPLVLVEALASLQRRGSDFEATFAGARFRDGCVERFADAVERNGLAGRVRYIGPVHGDAKIELWRDHDVFVLPSHSDAFPLVLLEAMQQGLPVVSTLEGAIPEIVVDDETGFLVPPKDPEKLASRLARLIDEPALRREMGASGRARYLERFTVAHFERALADAITHCLEGQA